MNGETPSLGCRAETERDFNQVPFGLGFDQGQPNFGSSLGISVFLMTFLKAQYRNVAIVMLSSYTFGQSDIRNSNLCTFIKFGNVYYTWPVTQRTHILVFELKL